MHHAEAVTANPVLTTVTKDTTVRVVVTMELPDTVTDTTAQDESLDLSKLTFELKQTRA